MRKGVTGRLGVLSLALVAIGCTASGSVAERAGRNPPPEDHERPLTRLEERIKTAQGQLAMWQLELAASRDRALEPSKLDEAMERLRSCQDALERLRKRASEVDARAESEPDLEREAIRIHGLAEKAYGDGQAALGVSPGGPP